ncbi:MAG TPA: 23S rRNA (adenine(2503)-C(2))-methyltransferase RlmN [Spirochaetales bacterium]|nr:23S rRNA (adenine(2503)-C(2))-methyltransferase RlmN [Spirochaetales bacterium]HRY56359.1 23S rRNA (adenine(2503)-C(2))-methyltransferase RlmN [Spirochaetia bacterium]HRZ66185.1 23S rRNA (adenine(2503)-C(2))-methyltransferase RlmN [Spirochaetia bacterium]
MEGESLAGLSPEELGEALALGEPYRARQVYRWIARGASGWEEMTDLPAAERSRLAGLRPRVDSSSPAARLEDPDGSIKLQVRLADGAAVECVLLEDLEGRRTACLSCQVGCPMGCAFCKTGSLGYLRDLSAGEIVEQFRFLRAAAGRGAISNVVFMGMGEPMLNLGAVRKAIAILSDPRGIGLSLRKITISTSGVVPGILDLAEHGPKVRLAVSLTSADDGLRGELMPVNSRWDLAALKDALARYQAATGERITLEAALMGGRNSSPADAEALVRWASPLKVQVNLIPWNKVPGLPFSEPSRAELEAFAAVLERAGMTASRRMRRGRGVMGACGQLGDTLRA